MLPIALLALAAGAGAMSSDGSPAVEYRDVRAVRDAAELSLDRIGPERGAAWLLVQVDPGPTSGGIVARDAHINIETGELVRGPDARFPVVVSGAWTTRTVVEGTAPDGGSYEWEVPEERRRTVRVDDLYSPFVSGGLVLCRRDSRRAGAGEFSPVYLLPEGWEASVAPALATYAKNRKLFRPDKVDTHREALVQLAGDANPLVALAALRVLARAGQAGPEVVRRALTAPGDLRRASVVYLLLTREGTEGSQAEIDGALQGRIAEARTADELWSFALGLYAAALERPDAAARRRQTALLGAVGERRSALGSATEADDRVRSLLDAAGVRPPGESAGRY